jgi:TPR repeat protein
MPSLLRLSRTTLGFGFAVALTLASGVIFAGNLAETRAASERENAIAHYNLGLAYAEGNGVPQDSVEAVRWYRRAAGQGNAAAQSTLGVSYHAGLGVLQDIVLAHMWLNISASRGDEFAANNRNTVAKEMTPAQIAEALRMAQKWKPTPE